MGLSYTVKPVHIDLIRAGDTVVIGGELKTVCAHNIKRGGFLGTTLFGDSFKSGYEPVQLAVIHDGRQRQS